MLKERVMADPAVHNWVKTLILVLDDKDVVDALRGIELLKLVMQEKFNDLRNQ